MNQQPILFSVLSAYGVDEKSLEVEAFGSGLINSTWKVTTPAAAYILQKVNENVFSRPANIAHNISLINDYLKAHHPEYFFVAPLVSKKGDTLVKVEDGYYRLFPFVQGSHAINVVQTPGQAYEAAKQFGTFTHLLSRFDAHRLKTTIPHFHDLGLRYRQFLAALKNGNVTRLQACEALIKELIGHEDLVHTYEKIKENPLFKLRVTHHDTKISNVLFNAEDKGICVIDLDTVMPGYFISDVGDMMRTYLSPVSEETADFEKIEVRADFYAAIVQGYAEAMQDELAEVEKRHFFYAGQFMIYMQALRFLTDYINNDIYYGAAYPGQNLVRAQNQAVLLQRLLEKKAVLD